MQPRAGERSEAAGSGFGLFCLLPLRAIAPPSPILPREVANLAYFAVPPAVRTMKRIDRLSAPHWRALTSAATIAAIATTMNSPFHSSEEIFHRLLDESSALLAAPGSAGIAIPDDELHREIIVPLLPAMLGDKAIRGHWSEQAATGFVARIARHFENGDPAPRWTPGDFEIHVTASYSAGADARALADTLLSEESLRDMTATLMNQLLDTLWLSLAPAASASAEPQTKIESGADDVSAAEIATPAEVPIAAEIPAPEIPAPLEAVVAAEISEPILPAEEMPDQPPEAAITIEPPAETGPQILRSAIPPSAIEPESAEEIAPAEFQIAHQRPSRALIRARCRKLSGSIVRRGIAANSAQPGTGAAVVARRILQRTTTHRKKKRIGSRTVCIG